jgi:hypothetical protein
VKLVRDRRVGGDGLGLTIDEPEAAPLDDELWRRAMNKGIVVGTTVDVAEEVCDGVGGHLRQEGEIYFLEVNPTGEWAWLERELGFPVSKALCRLLSGDRR